ncbi:TPA: hypothetical protein QD007_003151 [Shewanella algae]|uniref:hypothetical protein n=1 Tax=Shewanella algae TaxID=38313 RepID=UPI001C569DF0|nr:hypothetical protein [Shewanella algae]HDS1212535.1 hypothetical protein [Shewanella algae]
MKQFLIGTEEELLTFAQCIIDSVKKAKEDTFFGEQAKTSNHIYGKLGSSSEVLFDWLVVTKNSEQTVEIGHKVQGL